MDNLHMYVSVNDCKLFVTIDTISLKQHVVKSVQFLSILYILSHTADVIYLK